ncbi:MAG: inositol monophosphatase [Firmicutes bacterium]|nr:inositol monophosphatase [Bacillota bacterium]
MSTENLDSYLKNAIEIAEQAGALLKNGWGRRSQVTFKGEIDLVTEMDLASERLITENLSRLYPGHRVVAEEGGGNRGESDYLWYVDPLDGTTNYSHGFPAFAVSIGLSRLGEPLVGVVYNPISEELFYAARGQGAFLNRVPIRVSTTDQLVRSLLATGFSYDIKHDIGFTAPVLREFLVRCQGIRRLGSAALDLCCVACGRFDGFWELKLQPWDTAAAALILTEAGGKVSDFRGGPFRPELKEIAASNVLIHDLLLQVINPYLSELKT